MASGCGGHGLISNLVLLLLSVTHCILAVSETETAHFDVWNPIITSGTVGSSFGYSVALHINGGRKYAMVGAPQAEASPFTIPGVRTPGAVYQCPLQANQATSSDCSQIRIDTEPEANNDGGKAEIKTFMRLGASVMSEGPDRRFVACAPAYKRPFFHPNTTRFPLGKWLDDSVGRCYILPPDLSTANKPVFFSPCDNKARDPIGDQSYLNTWLRFCLTGTALDISDNRIMAASAPGRELGVGMAWFGDLSSTKVSPTTPGLFNDSEVNKYPGLAIALGNFDGEGESEMAISEPMYGVGKEGSVMIAPTKGTQEPGKDQLQRADEIFARITGSYNSENFGYSLCAVDVDNDNIPELIVGAPLSPAPVVSQSVYEVGRVYVFAGTKLKELITGNTANAAANLPPPNHLAATIASVELLGEAQSWFGASAASMGDINADTFNDVAIGAPFETIDGAPQGAVYIYYGGSTGLRAQYVQRVSAEELDTTTRFEGFGFSIGRGMDVDGNSINDLIVGSPFSDHAVVMRGRPVVTATFVVKKQSLSAGNCRYEGTNVRCVNVSICGQLTSGSLVDARATYEVKLSTTNILSFEPRNGNIDETTVDVTLRGVVKGVEQCTSHPLYLTANNQQCSSGSVTLHTWALKHENSTARELTAVENIPAPATSGNTVAVDLVRPCSTCTAELKVETVSLTGLDNENTLVVGRNRQALLRTTIVNVGTKEVCTGTVSIFLGPHLSFARLRDAGIRQCTTENRVITCTLPPGQPRGVQIDYDFVLNVSPNLARNVTSVSAGVGAAPDAEQDATRQISKSVDLARTASIDVSASYTSSQLELRKDVPSNPSVSQLGPELRHEFTVSNAGPSAVPSSFVLIEWPSRLASGADFLYLTSVTSREDTLCNSTNIINYQRLEVTQPLPQSVASWNPQPSSSRSSPHYTCGPVVCMSRIVCSIPRMRSGGATQVSMTWRVYSALTEDDRLEYPIIANSTIRLLNVSVESGFVSEPSRNPIGRTSTTLYTVFDAPSEGVKWWIILLAVLAGVIILALCILILCKCGFFKRKRAPE